MAAMVDLTDQDIEDMAKPGGGLKERTIKDRARDFGYFLDFAAKKTETGFGDMVKTPKGCEQFTDIFIEFFYTRRVDKNTKRPKKGYAEKLKRDIKATMILEYKVDIYDKLQFPNLEMKWVVFIKKLVEEGRGEVTHKEEVPHTTMEKIQYLLLSVYNATLSRGTPEYEENIKKVPEGLRYELNRVLQKGSQFEFHRFNVRRGSENVAMFKVTDIELKTDQTYDFSYFKIVKAEKDKNHQQKPTNTAQGGVIPFMVMDENGYNPGKLVQLYLSFLPKAATLANHEGGYLFPKARNGYSKHVDLNKDDWYEPNMKGE